VRREDQPQFFFSLIPLFFCLGFLKRSLVAESTTRLLREYHSSGCDQTCPRVAAVNAPPASSAISPRTAMPCVPMPRRPLKQRLLAAPLFAITISTACS